MQRWTRYLMIGSAAFMAILGSIGLFAPQELLRALGQDAVGAMSSLVQTAGGLYLGFAATNWTAKESTIGGIYSRPLSLGNFLHFMVGAISLLKGLPSQPWSLAYLSLTAAYLVLAIAFGHLVFGKGAACVSPRAIETSTDSSRHAK